MDIERPAHERFRHLIGNHERHGDNELQATRHGSSRHGVLSAHGGASASTQRSHNPSNSAAVLTVGTNRQQRSHFTPSARFTSARTFGPDPLCSVTADTPNRVGNQSRYGAAVGTASPPACRSTWAERFELIVLLCRASSKATFT